MVATLPVRRLGYSSIEVASLVEDNDEVIVDQDQRHLQRPQLRAPRQHLELIVSCQPTFPTDSEENRESLPTANDTSIIGLTLTKQAGNMGAHGSE